MIIVEIVATIVGYAIGLLIAVIGLLFEGIVALFRWTANAERRRQETQLQEQRAAENAERQAQAERDALLREQQYRDQQRQQERERQLLSRMRDADRQQKQILTDQAKEGIVLLLKRELGETTQWTDDADAWVMLPDNLTGSLSILKGNHVPREIAIPLSVRAEDAAIFVAVDDIPSNAGDGSALFRTASLNGDCRFVQVAGSSVPQKRYQMRFAVGAPTGDEFEFGRIVTRYIIRAIPSLIVTRFEQGLTVHAELWFPLVPESVTERSN